MPLIAISWLFRSLKNMNFFFLLLSIIFVRNDLEVSEQWHCATSSYILASVLSIKAGVAVRTALRSLNPTEYATGYTQNCNDISSLLSEVMNRDTALLSEDLKYSWNTMTILSIRLTPFTLPPLHLSSIEITVKLPLPHLLGACAGRHHQPIVSPHIFMA